MDNLILVAEPGDELIGCFSVFSDEKATIDVFYVNSVSDTDARQIQEAARATNYVPHVWKTRETEHLDKIGFRVHEDREWLRENSSLFKNVYVPSRKEMSNACKDLNTEYRSLATHFYSVDMHDATRLPERIADLKKLALFNKYPERREDWLAGRKYLYEKITPTDYEEYRLVGVDGIRITCLEVYSGAVEKVLLEEYAILQAPLPLDRRLMDKVMSVCPRGKLVVQSGKTIYEV